MVIETEEPTQIDLTSMSDIYKVLDNLHMLWMCTWMCPHDITAAHVNQAFGFWLEFCVTPRQQIMVKCSD